MDVLEVNLETGKVSERNYTEAERLDYEKLAAQAKANLEADIEAQAKREAALSKLAALGLTADDLRALGL